MAVSPFDRRKKTRRAQLEDVDRTALDRFKAANRVKRKLDSGVTASGHLDKARRPGFGPGNAPPPTSLRRRADGEKTAESRYTEAAKRLVDAMAKRGPGARRVNREQGNPRAGKTFTVSLDRKGRKVHDYGSEKVTVKTPDLTRRFSGGPARGQRRRKKAAA